MDPLAKSLRPKKLEDVFGQEHILAHQQALLQIGSFILWGPPGCGNHVMHYYYVGIGGGLWLGLARGLEPEPWPWAYCLGSGLGSPAGKTIDADERRAAEVRSLSFTRAHGCRVGHRSFTTV